jgi:predicted GIY-YIG superfamily endonuclease
MEVGMHYLYILYSLSGNRYYVGSSAHPNERLEHHNATEKGFTSRYRPWSLVFHKEFASKAIAEKAERKVKSWKSKRMIELLLQGKIHIEDYL